mgnify:CR=1 FL=1
MFTLDLNEEQRNNLLRLLDMAVKAGGLQASEAALSIVKAIKPVEVKEEKKKK